MGLGGGGRLWKSESKISVTLSLSICRHLYCVAETIVTCQIGGSTGREEDPVFAADKRETLRAVCQPAPCSELGARVRGSSVDLRRRIWRTCSGSGTSRCATTSSPTTSSQCPRPACAGDTSSQPTRKLSRNGTLYHGSMFPESSRGRLTALP
eukprot:3847930-Rhodomonas_salina.3